MKFNNITNISLSVSSSLPNTHQWLHFLWINELKLFDEIIKMLVAGIHVRLLSWMVSWE